VYPGTLVGRGQSTLLTRISQTETIHVRVSVPERDYIEYSRRGQERVKAGNTTPLKFEMVLSDGSVHPEKGDLVFVDRAVDAQTGTILLEVAFPNPGGAVRSGQFARVRVAIDEKKGAILVPQRAVTELQGVYNVAVVKPDDTVDLRMVQAAERVGTLWVIDSGLNAGERIVVEGVQKVRAGMKVTPVPTTIGEAAPASPITASAAAPEKTN
jgi:membrane fusion protein (multidrug efflux system)